MPPPVRLLCTGDLHVGRYPSYVPAGDRTLSVESAWRRTVDWAVQEGVDAVVLTGDVADEDNKVFEAFGPLKEGVERLAAAGIRTFAVAGNHDFDALHRLADLLDPSAFTLLGPGGTWSVEVLERGGTPVLRLVGWSFPDRYVRTSPLDTFPSTGDDLPVLGVLHADLDQANSPYAPVRFADLTAAPVAGWLLGHIHRPSFRVEGGRGVLYPGSLQPLDPGERGPHGPWLVTVDAAGSVTADHRPLATVRYDEVVVDLKAWGTGRGRGRRRRFHHGHLEPREGRSRRPCTTCSTSGSRGARRSTARSPGSPPNSPRSRSPRESDGRRPPRRGRSSAGL